MRAPASTGIVPFFVNDFSGLALSKGNPETVRDRRRRLSTEDSG